MDADRTLFAVAAKAGCATGARFADRPIFGRRR
jgi:hypothetical protein